MRDIENLLAFWTAHPDEELVLATIVRKQFSGYRSVGARKLISRDNACGLLSGGCLEAEIDATARNAWDALPMLKTFTTTMGADRVFGYQTGCSSIIEVFFEKLSLCMDTEQKSLFIPYGENVKAAGVSICLEEPHLGERHFVSEMPQQATMNPANPVIYFDHWIEPIRLCIIGCGPDAPAFKEIASMMGWRLQLLDYRPGYISTTEPETTLAPLAKLADYVPEGSQTAVVLMTHNYNADLHILNALRTKKLAYLGCLGPRERFEQLKHDLYKDYGARLSPDFETRVHAPAGMFSSGRFPEEIALSIVAQIQSLLRHAPDKLPCPT
jgi:xanthine dehydrogenase accessory factor